MEVVILYGLMTAALYYLGSRAVITQWLWSRYPIGVAKWADCSACSGSWYGLVIAMTVGWYFKLDYLGIDYKLAPPVVMLCSMSLTPMIAGLMQLGFDQLGSTITNNTEPTEHL